MWTRLLFLYMASNKFLVSQSQCQVTCTKLTMPLWMLLNCPLGPWTLVAPTLGSTLCLHCKCSPIRSIGQTHTLHFHIVLKNLFSKNRSWIFQKCLQHLFLLLLLRSAHALCPFLHWESTFLSDSGSSSHILSKTSFQVHNIFILFHLSVRPCKMYKILPKPQCSYVQRGNHKTQNVFMKDFVFILYV